MRLTRFTDYSLRVLIVLALRPNQKATIAELAQTLDVSRNHLGKVVQFLGQHGWADTLRGRGGGLVLGCPADQISLGEVVLAAEGAPVPAECFESGAMRCQLAPACHLQTVLNEASQAFQAVLDRHTLRDLVREPEAMHRIWFASAPLPFRNPSNPSPTPS